MPAEDAQRWNRRYRDDGYAHFRVARPLLLEYRALIHSGTRVLDVACGLGGNADCLIERGARLVGVDISAEAIRRAKQAQPELRAVLADMTELRFPAHSFDAVLNFYYLDRALWPEYTRLLKPGGLLIFETLTRSMLQIKPDLDLRFLLQPGELWAAFQGWEILYFDESWQTGTSGKRKHTARLVARSPL